MNSLIAAWEQVKSFMLESLKRVEESALFERLVTEYESLEVRQQKWIQASLVLLFMAMLFLVLFIPFWGVWSQKNTLESSRDLISEMKTFEEQSSVVHKAAPRPRGLQSLPIANAEDLADSLKQFAGSIDLGGDLTEITAKKDSVTLSIPELSIRQALAIIFQTDGWFPAVRAETLKIQVNPDNKELLQMEAEFRYVDGFQAQMAAGTPSNGGNGGSRSGTSRSSSEDFSPDSPGGATRARGGGDNSFSGSDEFEGDIPPPPTFEEDM